MNTASCWGEGVCSEGARRVAIKNHRVVINRRSPCLVCAYGGGWEMGGGIFALRRPRPYSRHLRGYRCGGLPSTIICAHVGINGNGAEEDHDAARRVATSFEKRENRF